MSTHLITGYAGREHITSADQGSFNAAIMGNGEFVLERGEQFRCQVVSNNNVRIFDGDALMQGRHIIIDRNTYEETTHDNGTQGYKRIDLIVLTYEKNPSTGIETVTLDVIKGTPDANNPSVPSYVTGDIANNGELKNQMPLYKIPFDGLSIGTPEKMFSVITTLETMKEEVSEEVAAKKTELDQKFATLEGSIDEKIADAGKPLVSDLDEMTMIQNYGEYSADAKAVGRMYSDLKASDGLKFKFGKDGDGNYGYYGADGSLIPFKSGSGLVCAFQGAVNGSDYVRPASELETTFYDEKLCTVNDIANFTVKKTGNLKVIYTANPYNTNTTSNYTSNVKIAKNGVQVGAAIISNGSISSSQETISVVNGDIISMTCKGRGGCTMTAFFV